MNETIHRISVSEEDAEAFTDMADLIAKTLASERGVVMVIADVDGDGTGQVLVGGNQLLVGPLMTATAAVVADMFHQPEGLMQ